MDVKKGASYLLLASFRRVLAAMQHGSGGIPFGAFASFVTFVSLWALVAFLTLASFLSFLPFICNVSIGQSGVPLPFSVFLPAGEDEVRRYGCGCAPMGGRSGSPLNMVRGGPKSQKVGESG